jgi:hypothetical protein
MNFGTWNVKSVYPVGSANNPNGGTLYNKERPATNNSQQKDGKTPEKMGRWSDRMPSRYLSHGFGKQSQKYRILDTTYSENYGSIWAVIPS